MDIDVVAKELVLAESSRTCSPLRGAAGLLPLEHTRRLVIGSLCASFRIMAAARSHFSKRPLFKSLLVPCRRCLIPGTALTVGHFRQLRRMIWPRSRAQLGLHPSRHWARMLSIARSGPGHHHVSLDVCLCLYVSYIADLVQAGRRRADL
jgi:hypothetical protein